MASVKAKDTKPEMTVRRLVHGLGYRYRLHQRSLPGSPDLVFKSRRKVIFVHGCFWHQHSCGRYSTPKSRKAFWLPKLSENKARDQRNVRALRAAGWGVMTVWECQTRDAARLERRIVAFLERE